MKSINEIINAAVSISNATGVGSITPQRVGNVMVDTLKYMNESQIFASGVICKIYQTEAERENDLNPVSEKGTPLLSGQLVIVKESASIWLFNKPGWTLAATLKADITIAPDWDASETEAGFIKNRPFYRARLNSIEINLDLDGSGEMTSEGVYIYPDLDTSAIADADIIEVYDGENKLYTFTRGLSASVDLPSYNTGNEDALVYDGRTNTFHCESYFWDGGNTLSLVFIGYNIQRLDKVFLPEVEYENYQMAGGQLSVTDYYEVRRIDVDRPVLRDVSFEIPTIGENYGPASWRGVVTPAQYRQLELGLIEDEHVQINGSWMYRGNFKYGLWRSIDITPGNNWDSCEGIQVETADGILYLLKNGRVIVPE